MNNTHDSDNLLPNKYFAQIYALTPKDATQVASISANTINSRFSWIYSPWLTYGTLGIFFGIFFIGLIIQIVQRSVDFKRTMMIMIVAFLIASVPVSLKTALEITSVQTKATPEEEPKNIIIVQSSPGSVTVSWNTQVEKFGAVRYGEAPLNLDQARLSIANNGQKNTQHQTELIKLEPQVDYEAEILSGDKWYNDHGRPLKIRLP